MKTISRPLTAEELSLILDVSESTIQKMARTKQLPCTYVNRKPSFDFERLLRYFRELEGGAA
jgi:hypothetical protein